MRKPRVLVYNPYLDTLGGGERVTYALVEWLATRSTVELAAAIAPPRQRLASFGFPDLPITVMPPDVALEASNSYDMFITIANVLANVLPGPPAGGSTTHVCIVQFPMDAALELHPKGVTGARAIAKAAREAIRQREMLHRYTYVTYSSFCAKWVARRWKCTAKVLHPPVVPRPWVPERKSREIVAVGRFFDDGQHRKRHDALIDALAKLLPLLDTEWTLTLAGACSAADRDAAYLEELKQRAHGLPVRFAVNAPVAELDELYQQATLFWHATGFGRPPDRPEQAEHFGISTVEAMSAGCVPLVYADGGQNEIVRNHALRWRQLDQLVARSDALIRKPNDLSRLADVVHHRAERYSPDAFAAACDRVFTSLRRASV
jgi:glycosyltransferase involved in cell wall biosynthesis